jgi:membrane fusion protein (multidrug efflux system)
MRFGESEGGSGSAGEREDAAQQGEETRQSGSLFRGEALDHHLRRAEQGEVLRIDPAWMRWCYRLVLAVVLFAGAYAVLGTVNEYASGPAVLRVEGRMEVTAPADGTVSSIEVEPGRTVRAGEVLVRLRAEREEADLRSRQEEFDLKLADRLRDPGDKAVGAALATLRAELELARARVDDRLVKAPRDGLVQDVRVREGQFVNTGDPVLALVPPSSRFEAVALLAGQYRPHLREGMPLRIELKGQRSARQWARIDRIGGEIIGPAEARRYLGPEVADAVEISGPCVLVHAELPSDTFRVRGVEYRYHDGMLATAEAPVRAERILFLLLPQLRGGLSS